MKRAIIIGASSGMGKEVSKLLLNDGWQIGVGARRTEQLEELKTIKPEAVTTASIDVMAEDAPQRLEQLIADNGGMDLFFLASGIGKQNPNLDSEIELRTVATNVLDRPNRLNLWSNTRVPSHRFSFVKIPNQKIDFAFGIVV